MRDPGDASQAATGGRSGRVNRWVLNLAAVLSPDASSARPLYAWTKLMKYNTLFRVGLKLIGVFCLVLGGHADGKSAGDAGVYDVARMEQLRVGEFGRGVMCDRPST